MTCERVTNVVMNISRVDFKPFIAIKVSMIGERQRSNKYCYCPNLLNYNKIVLVTQIAGCSFTSMF